MAQPDFDPQPVAVRIYPIQYISKCKAVRCRERATTAVDGAGRHVRQVELCDRRARAVVDRERARGLESRDWR